MKKTTIKLKLLSLLLAFAMIVPMFAQTIAFAVEGVEVETAKAELLSCTSEEEVERYISSLTEQEYNALMAALTDDEILALAEKVGVDISENVSTPAANYIEVGPLMPPIDVMEIRMFSTSRAVAEEDDNGLSLSKDAKINEDGSVTISLEAFTTGKVTTSHESIPTDIVLVLDESGSMSDTMYQYEETYTIDTDNTYYVKQGDSYIQVNWCTGGLLGSHEVGWYSGGHFIIHWGEKYVPMTSENDTTEDHVQFYTRSETATTKSAALMAAATTFVENVYNDAQENDVDHRVSVVGFSGDGASQIKIGLNDDIRNNLGDADTPDTVLYAVNNLNTNGGTYIEDGMSNAKNVFDTAATTTATNRNRVVVVFTDGIPGSGTWNNTTINNSANPAIQTSHELKVEYGATVYTIGMLDEANPELPISDETNDSARTNRFLHYLSSNYVNATSMNDGGDDGGNYGYYLSASDTASLDAIFKNISENISTPTIDLGSTTTIKDIIAPQFKVSANATGIKLYTENYNGTAFDGDREHATGVTASINGDAVEVTGFDFNANFVSETPKDDGTYGKKLIIEFTVAANEAFLGGNGVYTNGEDSGLYTEDGSPVEKFDNPTIDVPVEALEGIVQDRNIYFSNEFDLTLILDDIISSAENSSVHINGVNNAYVTISYAVKDEIGNLIATYTLPKGATSISEGTWTMSADYSSSVDLSNDTTYSVTCTVDGGSQNIASKDGSATVQVFKPVITFSDSVMDGGDTADYETNNRVSTIWKHDATLSTDVTMVGPEPALTPEYTPAAGAFTEETRVDVTVKVGDWDITDYVTFEHEDCSFNGCSWAENDGYEFIVHLNTTSLTIDKVFPDGKDYSIDENQTFIFTVEGADQVNSNVKLTVTIHGDGQVTIKDLPVGNYTVTEKNWSWRYKVSSITGAGNATVNSQDKNVVTISLTGDGTLTFTNTRSEENDNTGSDAWKWLDGNAWADNRFYQSTNTNG